MKKTKQTTDKERQEIDRLKSIVKQLKFDNIADCTEFFNNEFGKLKVASPKFIKKNFYKKIGKILEKSYLLNLSSLALIDTKTLVEIKQQIKDTSSQVTTKPQLTTPTTPQLSTNETKLLNNTQGEQ